MEHVLLAYKEKPHLQARLPEQFREKWVHKNLARPLMGIQPQALVARPINNVATNSFDKRMEPSFVQPYQREQEPSMMEPYLESPINSVPQHYSRTATMSMFMASQEN